MPNSTTEIKKLIEEVKNKFGCTSAELSQHLKVSEAVITRWNWIHGKRSGGWSADGGE